MFASVKEREGVRVCVERERHFTLKGKPGRAEEKEKSSKRDFNLKKEPNLQYVHALNTTNKQRWIQEAAEPKYHKYIYIHTCMYLFLPSLAANHQQLNLNHWCCNRTVVHGYMYIYVPYYCRE